MLPHSVVLGVLLLRPEPAQDAQRAPRASSEDEILRERSSKKKRELDSSEDEIPSAKRSSSKKKR